MAGVALSSCSLITDLNDLHGDASASPDASPSIDASPDALGDVVSSDAPSPTGYRRKITVTTTTANVPAAYTIGVMLDANAIAHAQTNLSDVRVLVDQTFTEIDRVADVAPPNELGAVWFALPVAIAANAQATYWLDYGVSAATLTTATNVFAFYDDFSAPTLGAVWIENSAATAPTTGAGPITMPPPSEITTDYTADNVPVHSALESCGDRRRARHAILVRLSARQNDFVEGAPFLIGKPMRTPRRFTRTAATPARRAAWGRA